MADQIAELRETVQQLQCQLVGDLAWPPEWRLTPNETRILGVVVTRPVASKEALILATDRGRERMTADNAVTVHMVRLRRKLAGKAQIHTAAGHGYWVSAEDRARLRALAVQGGAA
jgi:DNA-binding response OmpR family regulator